MTLWPDANRAFYKSGVWATVKGADGRHIKKYPTDLYVFEEIIHRTKPEVIVETGSAEGGSASWFARYAEVVSVDLHTPREGIPNVTWIEGDSVQVAPDVARLVDGRSCLLTLDSDHNARHVLAELQAYAPLATEYLVVEDTAVDAYGLDSDWYPDGGPGQAVAWFLQTTMSWAPDHECERFLLGMNPGGWLRRVA